MTERSLIARLAAHERWAKCADPAAATSAARQGFEARFERAADPDGAIRAAILRSGPDTVEGRRLVEDLRRRAAHHRKAYFTRLALASAQARRRRASS